MRASRIIPAVVAGAAGAATQWNHHQGGVWCKSASIQGAPSVLCVPETGKGYGVGFNKNLVSVVSLSSGRTIFVRLQPGGYGD